MEHMSDSDLTALLSEPKTWSAAPGAGYEYSNLGYVILGKPLRPSKIPLSNQESARGHRWMR